MNGWGKKIVIAIAALTFISSVYLMVADGRYFPLREGDAVAGGMKSIAESLKFNLKAIKALNEEQQNIKEKFLEDKNRRLEKMNQELKKRNRELQRRPVAR